MKIRNNCIGFKDRHITFWVDLGDGVLSAAAATIDELRDLSAAVERLTEALETHNAEMHVGRLFEQAQEKPHLPERIEACETVAAMDDAGGDAGG
jgi:hypothetical protein